MNSNDIIKKMVKTVSVQKVDLDQMTRELVTCCTKDGTHLVEVDDDGYCTSCGYKETITDFKQ